MSAWLRADSALVPGLSLEGSIEVEGKAGDCVVFTEALCAPSLCPNPLLSDHRVACRPAGALSQSVLSTPLDLE